MTGYSGIPLLVLDESSSLLSGSMEDAAGELAVAGVETTEKVQVLEIAETALQQVQLLELERLNETQLEWRKQQEEQPVYQSLQPESRCEETGHGFD